MFVYILSIILKLWCIQDITMAYAEALEQRLQMLEQKVNNLEAIFNEFLERIFPAERVPENEARELENRLKDILTGKETAVDWREIEREILE